MGRERSMPHMIVSVPLGRVIDADAMTDAMQANERYGQQHVL